MISLKDYDGLNGFGASTHQDVNELSKALSAGYAVANQTGGASLRVESLESSLKVVTFGYIFVADVGRHSWKTCTPPTPFLGRREYT